MNNQQQLWLLLVLFVLAAAVRLANLNRGGLWGDEIFSLAIATGHSLEHPAATAHPELGDFVEPDHPVPSEEFRRYLKHENPPAHPDRVVRAVLLSDTSPPLYYLLLYGWSLVFGTSDVALRLLSTVCALGCLPLLIAIARRIGDTGVVFSSCVLFAFSPIGIYYSTEGRMYSLLWLCLLTVIFASLILRESGASFGLYLIWFAASAAGFLTHYFFVFPWLAIVAYLLVRPGQIARLRLTTSLLLTAVAIAPWYARLPASLGNWRITQGWLAQDPQNFRRVTASLELITQFFSGRAVQLWLGGRTSHLAAIFLFGIVAFAVTWRLRAHLFERSRLLIWLPFAAAIAAPLAIDLIEHTHLVTRARYAIGALPAAYLLAGLGMTSLGRRAGTIIVALILVAWSPNVLSIYRNRQPWLPLRELARAASANGQPTDLILVHSIPSGVLGIARYVSGPAPVASWVGQLGNRRMPESLRTLTAGRKRILFVKVHEVGEPAPEEDWLRANATVHGEKHPGVGLLVDFRPNGAETF